MLLEKKPKIAFVVPYPQGLAPGQRFRFEQYINYLTNYFDIEIFPFLDEETNRILYIQGHTFKKALGLIISFARRIKQLKKIKKSNVVFIFREASLIGPPIFEWIIAKILKKPIIFDFDDAIWLPNVSDANRFWKWLKFPQKTAANIKWSKIVIAGNSYLANYAKQFCKDVWVIPTTIDTNYHVLPLGINKNNDRIIIGWTGSDTTIKHFKMSYPFLERIKKKFKQKVEIHLISNKPVTDAPFDIKFIQWNKQTEIEDLSKFDIGIMPLPDDDWAKGKCGFKGLQYMALGIPSVMSPVGANKDIIENGINGFLPQTNTEWFNILENLINDGSLRKTIGLAGRKTIEEKYSVNSQKENYLKVLQSALS